MECIVIYFVSNYNPGIPPVPYNVNVQLCNVHFLHLGNHTRVPFEGDSPQNLLLHNFKERIPL